MSPIRHVLVHINDPVRSRAVLHLGAAIARRHRAEVTALLAIPPIARGAFLNAETASLARDLYLDQLSKLRAASEDFVAAAAAEHDCTIGLSVAEDDPLDALKAHARTSDLLLVGQRAEGESGGLGPVESGRLLLGAGCPVLFVPHIGWQPAEDGQVLQSVLVAWSGTRESARAMRDAMPLLAAARRVELVCLVHHDTPDSPDKGLNAVVAHLRRHGVDPAVSVQRSHAPALGERMRRGWIPDAPVAETLESHAADVRADLIVMGGYGHARVWEIVLGGVTRTMLQSMTVPVLMSH